jgi:hypothetical protein
MDQQLDQPIELKDPKLKDFANSWVDSSVFLFYLQLGCTIALIVGGSYGLWAHRYKGKPNVVVPTNTLYTPQYK